MPSDTASKRFLVAEWKMYYDDRLNIVQLLICQIV